MESSIIKRLCVSVFAALAAGHAQAVYLSTNGTGQVLIYPYYTVRNGFATLLSVTNTQTNTKILKVHFLEGMNGREVMNFNLFLAPNDTWTGVVTDTASGTRLLTNDNSCVTPSDLFTETRKRSGNTQTFNEFYNFSYAIVPDERANVSLDRTREGYFEIIEMGVIDANLSNEAVQLVGFVGAQNCAALDRFDGAIRVPGSIQFPSSGASLLAPPRGGLRGWASLINATSGANYSFRPTVLDGWSSQVAYSGAGAKTLLSDVFPATSIVTTPAGVVVSLWDSGRDAVSAVLMRETLTNDFVLDTGTASQTDWIITFPTKPFYTYTGCYGYAASSSNREGSPASSGIVLPGGALPPAGWARDSELCNASNVVPFLGSQMESGFLPNSLLGSTTNLSPLSYFDVYSVVRNTMSAGFSLTSPSLRGPVGPNGRATFLFNGGLSSSGEAKRISPFGTLTTTPVPVTHFGLPVIGLMLHNYKNANVVSRYGGVIEHSYSVRVE